MPSLAIASLVVRPYNIIYKIQCPRSHISRKTFLSTYYNYMFTMIEFSIFTLIHSKAGCSIRSFRQFPRIHCRVLFFLKQISNIGFCYSYCSNLQTSSNKEFNENETHPPAYVDSSAASLIG